jgi:hypothetical protein
MPGVVPMLVKRGVVDLELYLVDQGLLNSLVSSKIPDVEVQKQASEVSLCFYLDFVSFTCMIVHTLKVSPISTFSDTDSISSRKGGRDGL